MNTKKTLREQAIEWRESNGVSQSEMAKLCGCSRGTYNQWECATKAKTSKKTEARITEIVSAKEIKERHVYEVFAAELRAVAALLLDDKFAQETKRRRLESLLLECGDVIASAELLEQ